MTMIQGFGGTVVIYRRSWWHWLSFSYC